MFKDNHNRKWLDKEIVLDSEKLHGIFNSYFNENDISSSLGIEYTNKVSCLFVSKLLDDKDCKTTKKRKISYRDIFGILLEVFDSLSPNDDLLTTECYSLLLYFHEYHDSTG